MTRVYLPATLALLERAQQDGDVAAPVAHGVTSALRRAWTAVPAGGGRLPEDPDTEEQLEFAASLDAAAASLVLIARDADAPRRRVVLAADVEPGAIHECSAGQRREKLDAGWTSAVALDRPVPWGRVVSLLVDAAASADRVGTAARALSGRPGLDDCDLLWYDVTETDEVIAQLRDEV